MLGHVTEPHTHLDVLVGLFAEDLGSAGGGREEAEEELHGRALARAVGAEQAGDAVEDLDVHPVERDGVAVALRQALRFEKGAAGRCCGHALTGSGDGGFSIAFALGAGFTAEGAEGAEGGD